MLLCPPPQSLQTNSLQGQGMVGRPRVQDKGRLNDSIPDCFQDAALRHQGQSGQHGKHLVGRLLNHPLQLSNCSLLPVPLDVLCFYIIPPPY